MTRTLSILVVFAIALLLVAPRAFAAPAASDELGDESEQTLVYYGPINADVVNKVLEHETVGSEMAIQFTGDRDER
jgi:hypothetical protein